MKLYNSNLSPFTARVRLVIYAKNLTCEMVTPPQGDAYKSINPIGKVPCLEATGTTIPESETICEFLEEMHPEPPLHGATPFERAKVRLLSRIGDLYIFGPLTQLFGQINPAERSNDIASQALSELDKGLHILEAYLEGTDYAVSGRLTLADGTLIPGLFFVQSIIPMFGQSDPMGGTPKVKAYYNCAENDPHLNRILGELGEALAAYQNRG